MLLKQKPKCGHNYLKVNDSNLNIILQLAGFMPKYEWNKIYYYVITKDLEYFIEMGVSADV